MTELSEVEIRQRQIYLWLVENVPSGKISRHEVKKMILGSNPRTFEEAIFTVALANLEVQGAITSEFDDSLNLMLWLVG